MSDRMRESIILQKVENALLLFGFICVVVPLYLTTVVVSYAKRLVGYFGNVDAVSVGVTLVTAAVVGVVGIQIMEKTADGVEESELLCAGLYGCGAPPILSVVDVFGVVLVMTLALVLVLRFRNPEDDIA